MSAQIDKTKLYGLLHELDGQPVQRQVRILKIGIGVPTGPDVHVWINPDNKWCVEVGEYITENNKSKRKPNVSRFEKREDAFKFYVSSRKGAANRLYPRKVPYFTFLRMAADGNFAHDFDAIEQHGPTPSEVEIVFLSDNPFDHRFAWFTAAELKCEGNGLNARRRLSLAKGEDEKRLAEEAADQGEKFFPIIEGCYAKGCMYARGDKPECKPHGRLYFQLVNSPRFGGTCTFDTTGFRSISQLFSCIRQIKAITGRGNADAGVIAGIPLVMVLRPYKVSHNGQPSIQYGVSLEFRAKDPVELARLLHQHAADYQDAIQAPPLQIGTGSIEGQLIEVSNADVTDEEATVDAVALESEFYGQFPEHEEEEPDEANEPRIAMPQRKSQTDAEGVKEDAPAPTEPQETADPVVDREAEADAIRARLKTAFKSWATEDVRAYLATHNVKTTKEANLDQLIAIEADLPAKD